MNLLCPTTKPTSFRKLQVDKARLEERKLKLIREDGNTITMHEGIEYLNFWKCLVLNWAYKHINCYESEVKSLAAGFLDLRVNSRCASCNSCLSGAQSDE